MTALRRMLALAALASASSAWAVPFHGCTFYRYWLLPHVELCASFAVLPVGTCTAFHPPCFLVPGSLVIGWMPDHFIEVTNRAGQSAFATPDAPGLKTSIAAARAWWVGHGDLMLPELPSATYQLSRAGHNYSIFFGRTLPVPYGDLGWRLVSTGWSAGTHLTPACFSAVTEFVAETWSDRLDSGDRELATSLASLVVPACVGGSAVVGNIPKPSVASPSSFPCAFGLPSTVQKARAVAAPGAYEPSKQCMGALGPLLPRTGMTEGDLFTAAQRVAWRTASLSEDIFGTGVGVQGTDKWQVVWPVATNARCFMPGSSVRPNPLDGSEQFPLRMPGYDNSLAALIAEHPSTEYVFAVWRMRTKCVIPEEVPAIEAEMKTFFVQAPLRCQAMNAGSGGP